MENEYDFRFILHFVNPTNGYSFADATQNTLEGMERVIRHEKKRGYVCTDRYAVCSKQTGMFEAEQIIRQRI